MEMRAFGRTGVSVSTLSLGAMMFGPTANDDVDECVGMIRRSIDAGINTIDTSDAYSRGASEDIVGQALEGRRDDIIVATKVYFPMGSDPNQRGGSRRWIIREVENSLRRLRTDWIDIYQLHRRDPSVDLEESLEAMSDLVRSGKVRMVGMSATTPDQVVEAQWVAERRAVSRIRSEQCLYNVFNRSAERQVFPLCERFGIGVMVYGPLNGGWLTGKYRLDAPPPEGSRATRPGVFRDRFDPERRAAQHKFALLDELRSLADQAGLPLTHLAYGFAVEHPAVSTVIIGPRTPEQLDDALAAADVRLEADLLDRLDELVAPAAELDPSDTIRDEPQLTPSRRRRGRAR